MALCEDLLDLLEGTPSCLGEAEQNMDERREVERAEDEVCFVCDGRQARRDSPCEREVEQPAMRT